MLEKPISRDIYIYIYIIYGIYYELRMKEFCQYIMDLMRWIDDKACNTPFLNRPEEACLHGIN